MSKLPSLWKLTFAHKLTFVAVFWIKRLFYNFHIFIVHVSEKMLIKSNYFSGTFCQAWSWRRTWFVFLLLSSTIIVSLKVHIPPDDTFSAERKTCYLLGKYGIRFVCWPYSWKNGIIWWYICGICRNAGRIWYWGAEWPCNLQKRELWQSLAHFQSPVLSTFGQSRIGDNF